MSVLKEQFERAEESSKRQRLSSDQANEAPPPPIMDTPLDVMGRPSLLELAAKEKEVRIQARPFNHQHSYARISHSFLFVIHNDVTPLKYLPIVSWKTKRIESTERGYRQSAEQEGKAKKKKKSRQKTTTTTTTTNKSRKRKEADPARSRFRH